MYKNVSCGQDEIPGGSSELLQSSPFIPRSCGPINYESHLSSWQWKDNFRNHFEVQVTCMDTHEKYMITTHFSVRAVSRYYHDFEQFYIYLRKTYCTLCVYKLPKLLSHRRLIKSPPTDEGRKHDKALELWLNWLTSHPVLCTEKAVHDFCIEADIDWLTRNNEDKNTCYEKFLERLTDNMEPTDWFLSQKDYKEKIEALEDLFKKLRHSYKNLQNRMGDVTNQTYSNLSTILTNIGNTVMSVSNDESCISKKILDISKIYKSINSSYYQTNKPCSMLVAKLEDSLSVLKSLKKIEKFAYNKCAEFRGQVLKSKYKAMLVTCSTESEINWVINRLLTNFSNAITDYSWCYYNELRAVGDIHWAIANVFGHTSHNT